MGKIVFKEWMMRLPNSMVRLALMFVALLAAVPAFAGPQPPAGWTEGYVMSNGIRIHYWRTGAGSGKAPLVMAHGSSDDALCWTNLATEFTDRYDIIMFDARGHGLSDPPTAADAADVQVEDLAGLIKALKLEKPILMGHSMGSASVAHFAAKYPDVPRAVILEDPALVRPATPPGAPGTPQPSVEERQANMLTRNNQTEAELVAGCMKNSPKWGKAECEIWAPSKRRHHPYTIRTTPAARPPMSELFAKITAPTLILKADAQGELRTQNEEVARALAKGKIVHITGAGHNVRRENKAQTIEVMKAFLSAT
jgi:pimeloyl-ACP methyl ester carboxylesterase